MMVEKSPRPGSNPAGRSAGVSLGRAANVFVIHHLTVVKSHRPKRARLTQK
jgi:hypothetical protein